jgi:hypothetical protein
MYVFMITGYRKPAFHSVAGCCAATACGFSRFEILLSALDLVPLVVISVFRFAMDYFPHVDF